MTDLRPADVRAHTAPSQAMTMDRILIVEDDARLGRQIHDQLRAAGYEAVWVQTGEEAVAAWRQTFGLMILDLMLPGAHGLDVLKQLRARASADLPVLILSARNDSVDKVRALKLGADDYLTKPFWPEELLARVEARLRRPAIKHGEVLEVDGNLALDVAARRATVKGADVELTRIEFDLLAALVRRRGSAISRGWLTEHVLDPDREGTERTLDVHVSRLRKKLGDAGARIATVWGVGYRLESSDAGTPSGTTGAR